MILLDRAVLVTELKIGFCSYGDFQPAFREKNGNWRKNVEEEKKRTTEPGFPLTAPLLLNIVLHSVDY